jgi:hypothetical protein
MDFDDLITEKLPPPNRIGSHDGEFERHLPEGAVMVAYALHLIRSGAKGPVGIHPDGMHAIGFPFKEWLERQGFVRTNPLGKTAYGGRYVHADGHEILLNPKSGVKDVTATLHGKKVLAECKGGAINTRHPGQQSKLAKGLHEAVGLLMASPVGDVQVVVVPDTRRTRELAGRLEPRCRLAGIGIALVGERGEVTDVGAIP